MTALVAAELLKLRLTRTGWLLLTVAVVMSGLRVAMVLRSAGTAAGIQAGATDAVHTLVAAAATGTVFVTFAGILSVTWEHRHQSLTGALLGTPDRRRLVVAKVVALVVVGAAAGLGLSLTGVLVAVLSGHAGATDAWSWLVMVVGVVLAGGFWAWFGVGIGLLVRNQTAALLVPVVWLLVLEPLVGAYGLRDLLPWLPGSLPAALVGPSSTPSAPPAWAALAVLVAYGALLTVPGARRLSRLDVT
jgi:ABC-2 type transport system permease protein